MSNRFKLVIIGICIVILVVSGNLLIDNVKAISALREAKKETEVLEKIEPSNIEIVYEPEHKYFDVPISEPVQDVIFDECEKHGISPAIVVAMIARESKFDTYALGDDGRSFGLMQIKTKWHLQRMIDLGCTDLFNPSQNVKVGIDYLAEKLDNHGGDMAKALTAYNNGHFPGYVTGYARDVMEKAEELAVKK